VGLMNNLQKIALLYQENKKSPYANEELVSLFESEFKRALSEENHYAIKNLFYYEYAYKILEKIYQQFFIHDDVMQLIINIKDKKILHQLESLCPNLAHEAFSFMAKNDNMQAYQFLKNYEPKLFSVDNIIQNYSKILIEDGATEVFKCLIDDTFSRKVNKQYLPEFIYQLFKDNEILQYTLESYKKEVIQFMNQENDLLYKTIKRISLNSPELGCTWINFAFSDKKLKSIQDIFEFEFSKSLYIIDDEEEIQNMKECLNSHLEKRLLENSLNQKQTKKEKMKI
jgi:hypothetical protein